MRHRKGFNHLGRTSSHRKAMLANMATSLILHKRITTTTAKAKALRMYVEPLITKSKDDTTHSRRVVFSYLKNKYAVSELFREVSPKIADRPGGYTRILKVGSRLGDNADMCIIELVDYNENLLESTDSKTKSTRRRRGGSKKKDDSAATAKVAVKENVEVITDEKEGTVAPDAPAEEATETVVAEVVEVADTTDAEVIEAVDTTEVSEVTETDDSKTDSTEEEEKKEA